MLDDEFIIWEVEGLCIGGYGAYRSTGIGYVLFMRGTPGAEKKIPMDQRKHIVSLYQLE